LDILNGGGWGCIYSHQPLPSRRLLPANHRRSAPMVRTVRPCTSTVEIATVSSNSYSAFNVSSDVSPVVHPGRSARTLKMHFIEPITFVFLQCSCPKLTLVSRTVRREGPDGPRIGEFSKKLLLSRLRFDVDELMHLRNDQLGKLVIP
jgi:hypothetical protein